MESAPPVASAFISAALGPIRRIAMACRSGQAGRAISEAHDLIGLGPGLTPSGDDFVGGLLFAAWHLGRAYPSLERMWDAGAVGRLIEDVGIEDEPDQPRLPDGLRRGAGSWFPP